MKALGLIDVRPRAPGALGDATASALPVDGLAQQVQPDVLAALARWRDVDQYSLHSLAGALTTQSGVPISDSSGYLNALHGFVAEQISYDHFSATANVVLPDFTGVPAVDIFINGVPVQIKEGTSAYAQVHEALQRYPGVIHFITDPATASRLQAEGIDAAGLSGLEPANIDIDTSSSIHGLQALESAGALSVPLLTTALAISRYWEAYDSGKLDAGTAIARAATDVGAQAGGAAVGLKIAAIYVVASGGFTLAALPLTAGAMLGALGLRYIVQRSRGRALREALATYEQRRDIVTEAARIVVEHSRDWTGLRIEEAQRAVSAMLAKFDNDWSRRREQVLRELCTELDALAQSLTARQELAERQRLHESYVAASGLVDLQDKQLALYAYVEDLVAVTPGEEVRAAFASIGARIRNCLARLAALRDDFSTAMDLKFRKIKEDLRTDILCEYAVLLERLSRVSESLIEALRDVRLQAERLGADWNKLVSR